VSHVTGTEFAIRILLQGSGLGAAAVGLAPEGRHFESRQGLLPGMPTTEAETKNADITAFIET
jgi:hypothetical protein